MITKITPRPQSLMLMSLFNQQKFVRKLKFRKALTFFADASTGGGWKVISQFYNRPASVICLAQPETVSRNSAALSSAAAGVSDREGVHIAMGEIQLFWRIGFCLPSLFVDCLDCLWGSFFLNKVPVKMFQWATQQSQVAVHFFT